MVERHAVASSSRDRFGDVLYLDGQGHDGMREPVVAATADGRRQVSHLARTWRPRRAYESRGPFSILQSFSKMDYRRVCNGGPITMELSDSVFRDEETDP